MTDSRIKKLLSNPEKLAKAKIGHEKAGGDLFVTLDGLRIAKRGHLGTPHAKKWIPLEPGYEVFDNDDLTETEIHITSNDDGAKLH
jgi:hypothetical protein